MTSILSLLAGVLLSVGGPVTGLSIQPAPERTEVVISMAGEVEYRDFTMEGPSRLVLDLIGAEHALPGDNFLNIDRGGVRSIRASQYSNDIVRLVIELDALVEYQVLEGDQQLTVVLRNSGGEFAPWSAGTAAPAPTEVRALSVSQPAPPPQESDRIRVTFTNTPIAEVLFHFAEFANRSIVPGAAVTGMVNAEIRDQPWEEALEAILSSYGFVAREMESGIIRVDNLENLRQREETEPVATRAFSINYATADELQSAVEAFLTLDRGRISVNTATNTLIVTDVPRVLDAVEHLIQDLDKETPQVNISAKILFIKRTDLQDFGVTYDLKDSQGNQLNLITPGAADLDGDGILELPDEQVDIGTDVVSLGGAPWPASGMPGPGYPTPTSPSLPAW